MSFAGCVCRWLGGGGGLTNFGLPVHRVGEEKTPTSNDRQRASDGRVVRVGGRQGGGLKTVATMAAASEGVPLRRKKNPALIRCERPSITRAAASVLPLNDGRPDASAESKGDGADGCKLTFRRLIRRHGLVPADPSGRAGGSSYFHWNQRRLFFLGEESQLVDQEAPKRILGPKFNDLLLR